MTEREQLDAITDIVESYLNDDGDINFMVHEILIPFMENRVNNE